MKTPFDAALRIGRREIDDMRLAINVQINQLVQVDNSRATVDATVARETRAAGDDALLSTHAYMMRMRAERARLEADKAMMDARLDMLRSRAAAAYGAHRAVESAAENFREEAARADASAQQARSDDRAATAYIEARCIGRRAGGA